jgi:hypothetical protein
MYTKGLSWLLRLEDLAACTAAVPTIPFHTGVLPRPPAEPRPMASGHVSTLRCLYQAHLLILRKAPK